MYISMNDPGYKQLGAYPTFICAVYNADARYNSSYTMNATAFSAATVLAAVQQQSLSAIYSSCAPPWLLARHQSVCTQGAHAGNYAAAVPERRLQLVRPCSTSSALPWLACGSNPQHRPELRRPTACSSGPRTPSSPVCKALLAAHVLAIVQHLLRVPEHSIAAG